MERDSRYYEALFEGLFPTLKKFDLKEEIQRLLENFKIEEV